MKKRQQEFVKFLDNVTVLMDTQWWCNLPDDIKEYIFKRIVPPFYRNQELYYVGLCYDHVRSKHWKLLWKQGLIRWSKGYSDWYNRSGLYGPHLFTHVTLLRNELAKWNDHKVKVYIDDE